MISRRRRSGKKQDDIEPEKRAVIVTDIQGDFTTHCEGALAVPETDAAYIEHVGAVTGLLKERGLLVIATQDWHPHDHISFHTNHPGHEPYQTMDLGERTQVLWPPHCVQGTDKAEILLREDAYHCVVQKGRRREFDSYSGFMDDGGQATELRELLSGQGISTVIIYGIATDYCVKATALDARTHGYHVIVVESLSRGVSPETTREALEEMKRRGVRVVAEIDPDNLP
jgi:nicotinamidase/pyrazinamidase